MHGYIQRTSESTIRKHLETFPAVAILGARQVGKSTLAKHIIGSIEGSLYLDLEDPRDLARLQDPMAFLDANRESLICIDEVQRAPGIFQVLRSYLDSNRRPGRLLILGSASQALIRQSSESLAGRISFIEIGPFSVQEAGDPQRLWIQGGYPESYRLDEEMSFIWRTNYIRTFLERDLPQLGISVPAATLRRFWMMLAHLNGSILNQSSLTGSMGVSVPTIRNYLDILEGALVIRRLPPYAGNLKKRLVKAPKVYIRDSGIVHNLLGVETYNQLLGHPCLGGSYETFVISSLLEALPGHHAAYYRTSNGAEVDLVLDKGGKTSAFEIKASSSPKVSRGFYESLKDIEPERAYVVAPVEGMYPASGSVTVGNTAAVIEELTG